MLASTVILICISLYHASTLRAVTQQRTLRTKVLSRSYLNRGTEGTGTSELHATAQRTAIAQQVARSSPTCSW